MSRSLLLLLTLACVALLATPAHAAEHLAVLELSGALPADQRQALTDAVRQEATNATRAAGIKVMTQENMETMLTDMGLDASCISEGACEVDTLRNLQANYGVTGKVTDFGGTFVVTLQLYEMRGGTMVGAERVKSTDALELLDPLLPAATRKLMGLLPGASGVGAAPVASPPAAAEVDADLAARMEAARAEGAAMARDGSAAVPAPTTVAGSSGPPLASPPSSPATPAGARLPSDGAVKARAASLGVDDQSLSLSDNSEWEADCEKIAALPDQLPAKPTAIDIVGLSAKRSGICHMQSTRQVSRQVNRQEGYAATAVTEAWSVLPDYVYTVTKSDMGEGITLSNGRIVVQWTAELGVVFAYAAPAGQATAPLAGIRQGRATAKRKSRDGKAMWVVHMSGPSSDMDVKNVLYIDPESMLSPVRETTTGMANPAGAGRITSHGECVLSDYQQHGPVQIAGRTSCEIETRIADAEPTQQTMVTEVLEYEVSPANPPSFSVFELLSPRCNPDSTHDMKFLELVRKAELLPTDEARTQVSAIVLELNEVLTAARSAGQQKVCAD